MSVSTMVEITDNLNEADGLPDCTNGVGDLLDPATLLPGQDEDDPTLPGRKRAIAVINQALLDIATQAPEGVDVVPWLMSTNDDPGTFEWWCLCAGLNAEWLRRRVHEWRTRGVVTLSAGRYNGWRQRKQRMKELRAEVPC